MIAFTSVRADSPTCTQVHKQLEYENYRYYTTRILLIYLLSTIVRANSQILLAHKYTSDLNTKNIGTRLLEY